MIRNYGKKAFKDYSQETIDLIYEYLELEMQQLNLTESQIWVEIKSINNILQGKNINQLSYESVLDSYDSLCKKFYKEYTFHFLFFLLNKGFLIDTPLCRLNQFYELFEKDLKKATFSNLIYFLNLEDKYWNLFLENNLKLDSKFRRLIVLSHLDKEVFPDKKMYDYINDKFENLKYNKEYITSAIASHLFDFKSICYDILNDSNGITSIDSFIKLIKKHSERPLFVTVLNYFVDFNIFKEDTIKETVILSQTIEKSYNRRATIRLMIKILETGKPSYWHRGKVSPFYFYNCQDPQKLEALIDFSDSITNNESFSYFIAHFDNSLSNPLESLSFYTYLEQIKYFNSCELINIEKQDLLYTINSFYEFYQHIEIDLFTKDGYASSLLTKEGCYQALANGFVVVNFNTLSKVPIEDKWIFCYKELANSDYIAISKIDFTNIKNETFRNWVKLYVWLYDSKIVTKLSALGNLTNSLNYIQDLKTGEELSFFTNINSIYDDINTNEIIAFKTFIKMKYQNIDVQGSYIYRLKSLLTFISDTGSHKFEDGVFIELVHHKNFDNNTATPIPNNDLIKLSNKLYELSKENVIYHLYYIIFYLALETELRPQQIFDLQIDCIKNTAKKNEFIIHSDTKTSNQECVNQTVTVYVKKSIDQAIKLTRTFRLENSNESLNSVLFIKPKRKKTIFGKFDHHTINSFLKRVCKSISIPIYSISNLRDTHMTKAEEYIIKQKFSDVYLRTLTSHKSTKTTISHYSNPSIEEMLEATNGVIIGDVDIKGCITPTADSKLAIKENLVSQECGYCSSDTCSCFSDLDCLLCKFFITTIDRKPYFEERIKMLASKIEKAKYEHDVSDLIVKKRLLLGYLSAIISLEEELNDK